jgi:feruloyl-CoA synthase
VQALLDDERVRTKFVSLLRSLAAMSPGTSTRVARAVLMAEPPSMDKGEATDKGSINQRSVLKNRAALVDELYAAPLSYRVLTIADAQGT